MNQVSKAGGGDEMRPEYDIKGGVRGKYFHRYAAMPTGSVVVTTNTTTSAVQCTTAVKVGVVVLGSTVTADAA